jgi:hypothetical protein
LFNGGIEPNPVFSVFHRFQYQNNSRGIKVDPEFKQILKEAARDENRSLSNFIKHCLLTYLKEKKGIDYKEED